MIKRIVFILSCIALGACETPLVIPHYAEITFAHKSRISVNVAKINIVEAYKNPGQLPHVETEFPIPPLQMAARWAPDRLMAIGASGEMTVTIQEASVIERPLEISEGLSGIVRIEQAERYDARLVVEISASDPATGQSATSTSTVTRSRTVAEDSTLNEREAIWYQMVSDMAEDLDAQLDQALQQYFQAFLP